MDNIACLFYLVFVSFEHVAEKAKEEMNREVRQSSILPVKAAAFFHSIRFLRLKVAHAATHIRNAKGGAFT